MESQSRLRDFFWYVVIGLGVVVGIFGTTFFLVRFVPEHDWPTKRWLAFTFFSVALFAIVVRMYWDARKPRKFWWLLALIFIVHVAAVVPLVPYIQHAYFYALFMPFEAMVIVAVVKYFMNVMPHYKRPL